MMKPAREAGCILHMHSDGDIRDLADELIEELPVQHIICIDVADERLCHL